MSNVHRLRHTDVIFFVSVNLRRRFRHFNEAEYAPIIDVLEASRRRLGFLLCGYVLMPDHWHALFWPQYPPLIEQVLHDAKKIMTLRLHACRGTCGPLWQHQYWAGWRMASTAMRLAILATCADTFYFLIDGLHFEPPLR